MKAKNVRQLVVVFLLIVNLVGLVCILCIPFPHHTGVSVLRSLAFEEGESYEFLAYTGTFNVSAGGCQFFYLRSKEGTELKAKMNRDYVNLLGSDGCPNDEYWYATVIVPAGEKLEVLEGNGTIRVDSATDVRNQNTVLNVYANAPTNFFIFIAGLGISAFVWAVGLEVYQKNHAKE